MNISVFAFLNITEYDNVGMKVGNYRGLFHRNRLICFAYTISVIGLAGFPITSGFVAKIYLFTAVVNSGLVFIPFLLALLILMAAALFYYLRLIIPLFEKPLKDGIKLPARYSQEFVLIAATIATILLGIYPEKLIELCRYVAYNI